MWSLTTIILVLLFALVAGIVWALIELDKWVREIDEDHWS